MRVDIVRVKLSAMPEPKAIDTTNLDAIALLNAANSASERVSGLHVAFMAVCVYVLVIVFGTTDLDLLVGKGVRLPVVNVDVPIVGFYAFAPYIVVLVHFNLMLQLQLLSRKLFAFDIAAPQEEGIGGLRDRLHIFPYTYYLVGKPSALIQPLIGLMVSITLVLLPLVTLLALQLQFLAYQSEAVTWWQRIAVWLDVVMIAVLWPVILHARDDWRSYWCNLIAAHVPRRRIWAVFVLALLGQVLFSFSAEEFYSHATGRTLGSLLVGLGLLLLVPPTLIVLSGWKTQSRMMRLYLALLFLAELGALIASWVFTSVSLLLAIPWLLVPMAVFWHPRSPRGSLALLLTLYIGTLVPLALHVDGGWLEWAVLRAQRLPSGATVMSLLLEEKRRLDLDEAILLAKPSNPESIALIRAGNWQEALKQIEPISLLGRNLRHARMSSVILVGADLRSAALQGARLDNAALQGANLSFAWLQSADLTRARLQGANLGWARLQGAKVKEAELQGANLDSASLQGTNFTNAELQAANLAQAEMQAADFARARLQGANLEKAQLQGANLEKAQLQGTNLKGASLYGASLDAETKTDLIDARELEWVPLGKDDAVTMVNQLKQLIDWELERKPVLVRLERASRPGTPNALKFASCLTDVTTQLDCTRSFDSQSASQTRKFMGRLHSFLAKLSCDSSDIALGIMLQIPKEKDESSSREGLILRLKDRLGDKNCRGIQDLVPEKRKKLRDL